MVASAAVAIASAAKLGEADLATMGEARALRAVTIKHSYHQPVLAPICLPSSSVMVRM
jgi:hypothetical protein